LIKGRKRVRKTTRHPFGTDNPLKTNELRLLRGPYTQMELAVALHIGQTAVQDWEYGKAHPSMSNLRELLKHYNAWTSELAGPALDFIFPQNPKPSRRKPWPHSKSTKAPMRS
jgi:transcriptional regulator with XRE-family HTH domain